MTYTVRPYRPADGTLPAALDADAATAEAAAPVQVVVNLSDHACLFFRVSPNIGMMTPRHWFRLGQVVHASRELNIHAVSGTLVLGCDLTGATELTVAAGAGVAATLKDAAIALARHVAALPRASSATGMVLPVCVAALPGVRDAAGESPFWQALGSHFCGPLRTASGEQNTQDAAWRERIANLLPRQPIYTSFLAAGASAIGQADTRAQPLQEALLAAGFRRSNYIDVVDGGPVLELV
jgi:arginine N-succinyltransferase